MLRPHLFKQLILQIVVLLLARLQEQERPKGMALLGQHTRRALLPFPIDPAP